MNSKAYREHKIGPFEYDEAVDYIKKFALALTNLGLHKRFSISSAPRPIADRDMNAKLDSGRARTYYQVVLIDKRPHEPSPEGLTLPQIHAAEKAGYAEPKVKHYEALGQKMTLNQWAKAVGVSYPTLKSRIQAGKTMEEAITEIAMKKASR